MIVKMATSVDTLEQRIAALENLVYGDVEKDADYPKVHIILSTPYLSLPRFQVEIKSRSKLNQDSLVTEDEILIKSVVWDRC